MEYGMTQYEYLILTANPDAYFPGDIETSPYRAIVQTGEHEGQAILNITHTENPTLPGDTLVLGADPHTGMLTEPFDSALWQAIRPYGNNPDGSATGYLGYHSWAGVPLRMLGDPNSTDLMERLYPDVPPFEIMVGHYWYEQAEFSGYGFLAEITGGADSRDPSARAMAVYSDPECTQYLWTGGAYQLGPSRLGQVDEEGVPLQVWFSDTPPGQRTAQEEEWHLACLFGSAQEGHATLPVGGELLLQFWDRIQE
jgi:hypothetical protein